MKHGRDTDETGKTRWRAAQAFWRAGGVLTPSGIWNVCKRLAAIAKSISAGGPPGWAAENGSGAVFAPKLGVLRPPESRKQKSEHLKILPC